MNVLVSNLIASMKVSLKHRVYASKTRHSVYIEEIVKKFISSGVIKSYHNQIIGSTKYLFFKLNIVEHQCLLYDIKVISKPGRKMYSSVSDLKKFKGVYDNLLVSTVKGILDYEECLLNKVGGEVICVYT